MNVTCHSRKSNCVNAIKDGWRPFSCVHAVSLSHCRGLLGRLKRTERTLMLLLCNPCYNKLNFMLWKSSLVNCKTRVGITLIKIRKCSITVFHKHLSAPTRKDFLTAPYILSVIYLQKRDKKDNKQRRIWPIALFFQNVYRYFDNVFLVNYFVHHNRRVKEIVTARVESFLI